MAEVNDANEAAQVVEVNVVVEHLQVLGLISAGDFSSVVAARRQTDNRIYCVKAFRRDMILAPDPNEPDTPLAFRVLRELRGNQTVSQLPHPFIAQCCFAYKNDDFLLIGMERAGATDLLSHLSDHGTIDEAAMRFYAIEIHLALAHFHSFDLVHRDVKPENIIIRLDGHIKLIDFSTCLKLTGRMGDQPPPSRLCSVAGTPEYMPPEIVIGLPVCESVDWWSFGCLICEMLIDRTPFYGDGGIEQVIARIVGNQSIATMIEHPQMPATASLLIQELLVREPTGRLGARPHGDQAVLAHEWFGEVNVNAALRTELEPPWIPIPFAGAEQAAVQEGDFAVDTHTAGQGLADTVEWADWQHPTEQNLLDSADWGEAVAFAEFGI